MSHEEEIQIIETLRESLDAAEFNDLLAVAQIVCGPNATAQCLRCAAAQQSGVLDA